MSAATEQPGNPDDGLVESVESSTTIRRAVENSLLNPKKAVSRTVTSKGFNFSFDPEKAD